MLSPPSPGSRTAGRKTSKTEPELHGSAWARPPKMIWNGGVTISHLRETLMVDFVRRGTGGFLIGSMIAMLILCAIFFWQVSAQVGARPSDESLGGWWRAEDTVPEQRLIVSSHGASEQASSDGFLKLMVRQECQIQREPGAGWVDARPLPWSGLGKAHKL